MRDITLTCIDCNRDFIFTVGEQKFFSKNGLSIPKRCKKCRKESFGRPSFKKNSFFENAKVYGMPVDVSGGLDVEIHTYYFKSPEKGFLAYRNNKLCFEKNKSEACLNIQNKEEAERYCLKINQKYKVNCQLWSETFYVHRH